MVRLCQHIVTVWSPAPGGGGGGLVELGLIKVVLFLQFVLIHYLELQCMCVRMYVRILWHHRAVPVGGEANAWYM